MPDLSRIHPCLVRPVGPLNIGSSVRAAKVMGLGSLSLIKPHADLDSDARKMSAGAIEELAKVQSYNSVEDAIDDSVLVIGMSARLREHRAAPVWLHDVVPEIVSATDQGKVIILFGTERTGLENEELDFSHRMVKIHTSDQFSSINVAQSVMIVAYELRRAMDLPQKENPYTLAETRDIELAVEALATALDKRDFFTSSKRALALRRVRDLLGRAAPHDNEISLLRGMIRSLDEHSMVGLDGDS